MRNRLLVLGTILIVIAIGVSLFIFAQMQPSSSAIPNSQPPLTGPIRYNCELSGGTFNGGRCMCPFDEGIPGQTSATMYDPDTGFCQSEIGGPAGDAFNASIGLPYGAYAYWSEIVMSLCTNSGGDISGAACICPAGKAYSKGTGKCE